MMSAEQATVEKNPLVIGRSPLDVARLGVFGTILLGKSYIETTEKLLLFFVASIDLPAKE